MRGIAARPYVISIFSDGKRYSREEIQKKVNEHFGEGVYTEKQIRDLLGNLVKAGKLTGGAKEGYRCEQDLLVSCTRESSAKKREEHDMEKITMNGIESDESVSIEEFVENLIAQCDAFRKYCDEPKFLLRVGKNADLNYMSRLYNEVKKTRRRLAPFVKKM